MSVPLELQLLGPVCVWVDGARVEQPSRMALALLAVLALRGRAVRRTELAELLWGPGRLRNLRQALYTLKKFPGADHWLHIDKQQVRLDALVTDLDPTWTPRPDAPTGEPLGGLESVGSDAFQDWLDEERVHLALRTDGRRGQVLDGLLAQGALDQAWSTLQAWLALAPDDEALLQRALDLAQRRGDTVEISRLRAQLGVTEEVPLDALTHAERRVLGLMVLEPALTPAQLARIATVTLPTVTDVLEHFARLDWLDGHTIAEPVVTRWHATTAPQVKSALHAALAEGLADAGDPLTVAEHASAAGDRLAAFDAWMEAGRVMGKPRCFEAALELCVGDDERRRVLVDLIDAYRKSGRHDEAQQALGRLDALAFETQDLTALCDAAYYQAVFAVQRHDTVALDRHARLSAELAEDAGDRGRQLRALLPLGTADFLHGRFAEALDRFERARKAPSSWVQIVALAGLGATLGQQGELEAATAAFREGRTLARRSRRLHQVVKMANNLAATAERAGELAEASEAFDECARLAERLRDPLMHETATRNQFDVLQRLGRLGEARQRLKELPQATLPAQAGRTFMQRAQLEWLCGCHEEAQLWVQRALAHFGKLDDPIRSLLAQTRLHLLGAPAPAGDPIATLRAEGHPHQAALCHLELASAGLAAPPETAPNRELAPLVTLLHYRSGRSLDLSQVRAQVEQSERVYGPWALCLLAEAYPDEAAALHQRAEAQVTAMSDGLLSRQREGLQARLAHWRAQPRVADGPLI